VGTQEERPGERPAVRLVVKRAIPRVAKQVERPGARQEDQREEVQVGRRVVLQAAQLTENPLATRNTARNTEARAGREEIPLRHRRILELRFRMSGGRRVKTGREVQREERGRKTPFPRLAMMRLRR
jgi:hypothetical protein